jgi:hypothetical protein
MIWFTIYGCGIGLIPMEKIPSTDTSDTVFLEPSEEPDLQPTNEPSEELDPLEVDDDGDGLSEEEGDCDDTNAYISPNHTEIPYDDIDNDCDEDTPDDDLDGDGFNLIADCNDIDPFVHPNATDDVCDGVDDNCDGQEDEGAQPDNGEPFDPNTPINIGELNNQNDTVFSESYLFPRSDEDGFQFWFEDDTDCIIFITDDPDHFTCTVYAPENANIQVDLFWQQEGNSTFSLYDAQTVQAGSIATFEGGTSECGFEDGGTYQFDVSSTGDASCMSSYTISCIKDDD